MESLSQCRYQVPSPSLLHLSPLCLCVWFVDLLWRWPAYITTALTPYIHIPFMRKQMANRQLSCLIFHSNHLFTQPCCYANSWSNQAKRIITQKCWNNTPPCWRHRHQVLVPLGPVLHLFEEPKKSYLFARFDIDIINIQKHVQCRAKQSIIPEKQW